MKKLLLIYKSIIIKEIFYEKGFEIDSDSITNFTLGDGTEIIEYDFENKNDIISLQNFNFNNQVKQISA